MSVEAIEAKIVEVLQSIPDIKKVYNPEPARLDTFPAATLFFEGFTQERGGFGQHTVTWRWIIRLYLLMQDERKAQTDGKQLVQKVADALRRDITIGGTCLMSLLREGSVSVVDTNSSRFLLWELVFEASERL